MARIRSIKPEFWSSEQVVECSPTARLLFIGLWNFADDAGRHPFALKRIKMLVFPGDSFSIGDILEWLEELEQQGLIERYQAQGREYLQISGWQHQKIEKPTVKHPGPEFGEQSSNGRREVAEGSPPDVDVDVDVDDDDVASRPSPPPNKKRIDFEEWRSWWNGIADAEDLPKLTVPLNSTRKENLRRALRRSPNLRAVVELEIPLRDDWTRGKKFPSFVQVLQAKTFDKLEAGDYRDKTGKRKPKGGGRWDRK